VITQLHKSPAYYGPSGSSIISSI